MMMSDDPHDAQLSRIVHDGDVASLTTLWPRTRCAAHAAPGPSFRRRTLQPCRSDSTTSNFPNKWVPTEAFHSYILSLYAHFIEVPRKYSCLCVKFPP